MPDPTLLTAPIGPGMAFIVSLGDSSAETSPQASPACLSVADLEAAATPGPLPAPDSFSPDTISSEKLENVAPTEENGSAPVSAPPPLPRRRVPQRKQRPGTFVQSWQFSFEPLAVQKEATSRGATLPADPAPKKKQTRKVQAVAATAPAGEEIATPSPGTNPTRTHRVAGYRRQHGAIHTPRVDFLLKKYLGDRSQEHVEPAAPAAEPVAIPALPPAAKAVPLPVPGLKRIVQVQAEQDAAIAAIKARPRQFRARPVPLEVAETTASRVAVTATAAVLQEDTNTAAAVLPPRRSSIEKAAAQVNGGQDEKWRARPVPPASAEPRYAEIVADSVLRRYSHGEISGESGEGKGLQKWMSWPGEQAEAGALTAMATATAVPPARPQSARPRSSSAGGYQAMMHLPEIVEEGEEMKI